MDLASLDLDCNPTILLNLPLAMYRLMIGHNHTPFPQQSTQEIFDFGPLMQDFESPVVEQEVFPLEGAQASGSSFKGPDLDISKGKNKLTESEFVDMALLQNKAFDLEQSSAKYDLIIRRQEIRISDLEKENSVKDAKISKLEANIGGLSALFFDLKQHLDQRFGDDFQPLSDEGEKIYVSSSGLVNPSSQPASERVVRPALDTNLDTFLSSGHVSAQERREKQIRVEQLRGKMLVIRHSDKNAPSDHP
ncbi:unnamed protein product [Lactuca saligna]|uniref:Uncharacterized protein n=1 Tax=Lactuca saligna TaxID=75948 RepID=A0AA35V2T5_LACSI|nr:unnamed protein product [Lactuca saligna]